LVEPGCQVVLVRRGRGSPKKRTALLSIRIDNAGAIVKSVPSCNSTARELRAARLAKAEPPLTG
jgi:hypothetical protein